MTDYGAAVITLPVPAKPPTTCQCMICGRHNLWIDPFPPIPRRYRSARRSKIRFSMIANKQIAIPLTSVDKRENFRLDVTRAQMKLTKATYQNRARAAIILRRLDLDGPSHRNPDGQEIACPQIYARAADAVTFSPMTAIPFTTSKRPAAISAQKSVKTFENDA